MLFIIFYALPWLSLVFFHYNKLSAQKVFNIFIGFLLTFIAILTSAYTTTPILHRIGAEYLSFTVVVLIYIIGWTITSISLQEKSTKRKSMEDVLDN